MKSWFLILMLLAGAAQAQAPAKTIRICDASGCSERERSAASPKQGASSDLEADKRLAALVALADRDAKAAFDLGLRYLRGDGVVQNAFQALEWLRSAGERGELRAQSALGRLYLAGLEEMGPDPAEAERWLTMAAGRGDKEAAKLLPEAVAERKAERSAYIEREDRRKNWVIFYTSHPYYTHWSPSGWQYR